MNNKYIIDGVGYEYGEEVEVRDYSTFDSPNWETRILVGYIQGASSPFIVVSGNFYNDFRNGKEFDVTFYNYIRKIQPTLSLSGRKAKLILDGTEHTVTFE